MYGTDEVIVETLNDNRPASKVWNTKENLHTWLRVEMADFKQARDRRTGEMSTMARIRRAIGVKRDELRDEYRHQQSKVRDAKHKLVAKISTYLQSSI